MTILQKILRVLRSPHPVQRLIQAVNKSPLRHLTKCIAVMLCWSTYSKRRSLGAQTELNSQESKLLAELQQKGFVEVSELIPERDRQALLEQGMERVRIADELKQKEIVKTKAHWVRLSDEDISGKNALTSNPMVKISLHEPLLRLVAKYLKQAPFLEYVLLTLSHYAGPELKSSQLWHFDRDNTDMLKFFVYLTDVNSVEDGPFTLIDKNSSANVNNSFFMRHLTDDEIFQSVGRQEVIQMIRPKLSCFVVDTGRCYHMGSRVQENHRRLLYTALFIGLPSNYYGAGNEKFEAPDFEHLAPLQKAALKVKEF